MANYYIPIIYIVPIISVDGQASPRLFIAPEIRHEKISYIFKNMIMLFEAKFCMLKCLFL